MKLIMKKMNEQIEKLWNKIVLNSIYPPAFNSSFYMYDENVANEITNKGKEIMKNLETVFIVICIAMKDTWVQKVFSNSEDAQEYANRLKEIRIKIKDRCPEWSETGDNDDYYYYWQRWHFWMELKDVYVMNFKVN